MQLRFLSQHKGVRKVVTISYAHMWNDLRKFLAHLHTEYGDSLASHTVELMDMMEQERWASARRILLAQPESKGKAGRGGVK